MATNTSKLSPTELDFDLIKAELKNYLSSQDEFSEYNFEGSALNVLMDVLSYNTHMNAFMANMMGNEMFLDSSSIRQSVISKSKEIGYTARSIRTAKSVVDIHVDNVTGSPLYITMNAGTQFNTSHDIIFSTKEDMLLYPNGNIVGRYSIKNIEIYEGRYATFSYEIDTSNVDQRIIIPSVDVDMSTLRITVKPDKNSTEIVEYFLNDDLNRLKPDSLVFFTSEIPEGYYEITFGDGVLGKKLINGNYVTLHYIISIEKEIANNIDRFLPYQRIDGYSDIVIDVIEPAYGAAEKESIESIKFLAPKMYQSQRRAVTTQDYEAFLLADYPWIDTINSWGGEYNDPPIYGKVFFAIKPKHTEFVSNKLKEEIKETLIKEYNVVTIVPEIIDPDYIYVNTDTDIFYVNSRTTLSESRMVEMATETIYKYFDDTTGKFKMDFRFSPMTTKIDDTDQAFDSSLSSIMIHKRIYPIIDLSQTFNLKFNNAIEPNTIESTYFNIEDEVFKGITLESVIKDDGNGKLKLIYVNTGVIINNDIGNVNYETGEMTFTIFPYNLPVDTLDIRIYATPNSKNIQSGYNQIIIPDESAINHDVNRKQGVVVRMNDVEIEKG